MIPTNDLSRSYKLFENEYDNKVLSVLKSGWYILGNEVAAFEKEFATALGESVYAASVDNGLNAIRLGLYALNIGQGDEVIVQANGYIATMLGIIQNGAVPVFADSDKYHNIDANRIEEKISSKTKAILVTHLYGMPTKMDKIMSLCEKYNLMLFEDCAQSHFATYNNMATGLFGKVSFFSFYPTKNLGAFGDGGAVVSKDKGIIDRIKILRNYGSDRRYHNVEAGFNSRLDEIQAGILRVKLLHWKTYLDNRKHIASRYMNEIHSSRVRLPEIPEGANPIWHQFVVNVEERDDFRKHMLAHGIKTDVLYPMPPYLQPALKFLGIGRGANPYAEHDCNTVVSLPIMDYMSEDEISNVIYSVNTFYL